MTTRLACWSSPAYGKAFCAGMDLKQFFIELNENRPEYDRILRLALEWRGRTLRYYPKPTIAMIHGYCFGGAFSIVEGCDLAIAAEDTTFGLSEINFGMFPGGTVSKSMANLMGPRDALWYGMLGRTFDGKAAQQMGFINLAVPAAQLEAETMKVASRAGDQGSDRAAMREGGLSPFAGDAVGGRHGIE